MPFGAWGLRRELAEVAGASAPPQNGFGKREEEARKSPARSMSDRTVIGLAMVAIIASVVLFLVFVVPRWIALP